MGNKSEDPDGGGADDEKHDLTVDPDWMFEYGKHLFSKYIITSADLAINTSYNVRDALRRIYASTHMSADDIVGHQFTNQEIFQKILLMQQENDDDEATLLQLTPKEEQMIIQTYLYHAFDMAFHSVWSLLKSDTYWRFQQTREYKLLCEQRDIDDLKAARENRDREYSRSLKSHSQETNITNMSEDEDDEDEQKRQPERKVSDFDDDLFA